jgi:cytidyltransferase-like protein
LTPVTPGHLDVIERARHLFARVTVLVAVNGDKQPSGTSAERAIQLRRELPADWGNVAVAAWLAGRAAMRPVDYDIEQYQDYAQARALSGQQKQTWINAFGAVLPGRRPLDGLDVRRLGDGQRCSVLESDGVSPVAIIGVHQLDAVGNLARLYGCLDVAIFIGPGV